ncbi:MAG: TonB family protein [Gemmatimonadetes bacterium]|nr:TonB family protein [Gemmatimonadota bacterium]
MSVVFHTAVIVFAINATLQATQEKEQVEEKIDFVEVKKDEPPPPKPPPQEAPPPPQSFQVLTAPVDIPNVLPDIDLTAKLTNEADFSGKGVQSATAVVAAAPTGDQPYFEFMVEKPVAEASNTSRPRYPDILKSAGVEGQVVAQFVVDTLGRIEPGSFKVLSTTHALFEAAVRSAVSGMRFIPAEVGDKRVRQLVQQPFVFAIAK